MPDRDETIKARVTNSEKEKFEQFLEKSNEFDSMSRFIRTIAHSHIDKDDEDGHTIDTDELKSAVEDGLTSLESELNEISERLADVEQSVDVDDETASLANDIYEELLVITPSIDDEFEDIRDLDAGRVEAASEEKAKLDGSPQAFSELFAEDLNDVRRALSRAMELYPDVEYVTEENGMRRYYRDER